MSVLLQVLWLAWAGLAPAQSPEPDGEVVPRPEWSIGDWWEFSSTGGPNRLTVVAREGDQYVLVTTSVGVRGELVPKYTRLYADRDGWITRRVRPNGEVTETDYKLEWVNFPLRVGKSWSFFANTPTVKGGRGSFAYFCKAERWEPINVGNQTVRALRIGCQQRGRDSGSMDSHVVWYAPEAKRIVKLTSDYAGGWSVNVLAWGTAPSSTPPSITSTPAISPEVARPPTAAAPIATPVAPNTTPPAADTEAPKIVINYPGPDIKVDRETIIVTGLVTDNVEVARVQVAVNGVEVSESLPRVIGKGHPIRVSASLLPGDNLIEITAADSSGNVAQAVRTVTRVVPSLSAGSVPLHETWAVVVGIGRYENPTIPTLRYSVADAEAMYDVLVGTAGVKKDHVILLTDRSDRKATLRNLKWALGTFLARSAKKDDTVLIFFAGHGAPEIDQRGIERDGLAKYVIPVDADPDDLFSTALPMDDIQTIFGRIEAERVVMFLDACYSGAAGGRTFLTSKTRASAIDDLFLERLTRSKGRAIVTAARPSEVAVELQEFGHGLFTYYLVQGLKGAADANRDGIVTLQELYEYLEQQVSRKSRSVGANQHPVMKGELEGVLPLTKIGGR